jgi:UDPglucose 6-dehydrogenase
VFDAGAAVRAYDSEGMEIARVIMPGVIYCGDACEAVLGADAMVIVTERDACALDFERVAGVMAGLLCFPIGR